eukprot:1882342-Pleurochrysis_carterae.AAC.2
MRLIRARTIRTRAPSHAMAPSTSESAHATRRATVEFIVWTKRQSATTAKQRMGSVSKRRIDAKRAARKPFGRMPPVLAKAPIPSAECAAKKPEETLEQKFLAAITSFEDAKSVIRARKAELAQLEAYAEQYEMLERIRSMISRQDALDIDADGLADILKQREHLEARVSKLAREAASMALDSSHALLFANDVNLQWQVAFNLIHRLVPGTNVNCSSVCDVLDKAHVEKLQQLCMRLLRAIQLGLSDKMRRLVEGRPAAGPQM